ncbi:MAG: hypothetical protein K0Q95_1130 [Bacteroidota bacterium]|jgi:hypothetical protein|nr:hypothetical protein [Bacteroidota bacterium]
MKSFLITLFTLFNLSGSLIRAQNQDLVVTLHESVLNKMFKAIGQIKGTSAYSFMFVEGTYTWTLVNPHFKIHPGRVDFETDVIVSVAKYNYRIHVSGDAETCYDQDANLILVEITKANFPLNVMFFGKPKHLWDVELAGYFETPFFFEGPLSIGTEFIFPMPDNTTRTVYTHPVNCGVKIVEKQIIVSAEMEFINRDVIKTPILINK